jgi:hypothetical protein
MISPSILIEEELIIDKKIQSPFQGLSVKIKESVL